MAYDLLVEITPDQTSDLQARLLAAAYRASGSREVAVVLRGVARDAADRLLDPVVRKVGTGVAGVRYLEPEEAVRSLRSGGNGDGSSLILGRREDWAGALNGDAPVVRSPEEGVDELERRTAGHVSPSDDS